MGIVRENINFERGIDPKKSLEIGEGSPEWIDSMLKKIQKLFEGMVWTVSESDSDEPEHFLNLYEYVGNIQMNHYVIGYRFEPDPGEEIKHYPGKKYDDPNIPVGIGWYSYSGEYLTANGKTPKEALDRINGIVDLDPLDIDKKIAEAEKKAVGLKEYKKFLNEIS